MGRIPEFMRRNGKYAWIPGAYVLDGGLYGGVMDTITSRSFSPGGIVENLFLNNPFHGLTWEQGIGLLAATYFSFAIEKGLFPYSELNRRIRNRR